MLSRFLNLTFGNGGFELLISFVGQA